MTLALDIATATDEQKRAEAIRRVVDEKTSVRATGAALGISKDKVHRWVTAHRTSVAAATVAA
ncbi:helix-turn-helix domain-containing protein [Rhodococcus sp. HM1]|uniref:helix-turn-helix domain-containing protein n=1 Tax=Rhodococcus sp. HM1 TaxID=2937759 RepID=UPI00200B5CD4|nr:helix-turn-helix domain-containing protein [Rhodococcus sp. HM1]MCK8675018.1 helix-turn-helix domain-containing protein [Rhodococcus sp. HM1]